jgi:hypothetical protein
MHPHESVDCYHTQRPSEIVVRAWARLMKAQQLALAAIERELKEAGLPPARLVRCPVRGRTRGQ